MADQTNTTRRGALSTASSAGGIIHIPRTPRERMRHHFRQYKLAGNEVLPGGIDWYEIRNEQGEFEGFAAVVKAVGGDRTSRELIEQAVFGLARMA